MLIKSISIPIVAGLHIVLLLLGILVTQESLAVSVGNAKPYQVKAVYLYNFFYFIYWPEPINSREDFYICLLGEDPFRKALDYVVDKNNKKSLKIKRLNKVTKADDCQILFIADSERENLATIFEYLHNKPILTVSDIPEFIEKGGMIKFYRTDLKSKKYVKL